eukprot:5837849-Lingulodinium_polyedra.AAC.1
MHVDSDAALASDTRLAQLFAFAQRLAGHGATPGTLRKSRGPPPIASNDRGLQINGGWMFHPAQANSS